MRSAISLGVRPIKRLVDCFKDIQDQNRKEQKSFYMERHAISLEKQLFVINSHRVV